MPIEEKPTRNYMAWYKYVGFEFIAQDMYLYDTYQVTYMEEVSTSNLPQNYQSFHSQPLTQQIF